MPNYVIDKVTGTTTHAFAVDPGESPMPFQAMSSLWITTFHFNTIIGQDSGSGIMLTRGSSCTRTLNLATMSATPDLYLVHSTASLFQWDGANPILVFDADDVLIW